MYQLFQSDQGLFWVHHNSQVRNGPVYGIETAAIGGLQFSLEILKIY